MYHIIFVCKYRRKILSLINDDLKHSILKIAHESNFEILEMETYKDHIHLLVSSEPKVSVLSIVRLLKQRTTHDMWQLHDIYLKKYYWKEKHYGHFSIITSCRLYTTVLSGYVSGCNYSLAVFA